jgi:hypothetical protein
VKDTGQVYYFHMREYQNGTVLPCGGVTVAFQYWPPVEIDTQGEITWAMAICSPEDNFEKRAGRVKAGGRLHSPHHCKLFEVDPEITVNEVINQLREFVYLDHRVISIFGDAENNFELTSLR